MLILKSKLRFVMVALLMVCACAPARAVLNGISEANLQADVDWPMYDMPHLPDIEQVRVFDDRFIALWQKALQRPDVETRRRAVQDIGRANALGMKGLDVFVAPLIEHLNRKDEHPVLVLTIAKTLIQMNAKSAADSLFKLNQKGADSGVIRGNTIGNASGGNGGIELVLLADPALAKWKHAGAIAEWLKRLDSPNTPRPVLLSAIESLAQNGNRDAIDRLTAIATDRGNRDVAMRLLAARTLASIQTKGLEPDAETLTGHSMVDRLVAATLLARHEGDNAIALLRKSAMDAEAAISNIAVKRLLELGPKLLESVADQLLKRTDAKLRLAGAQSLAVLKSKRTVSSLLPHLDDHSPAVRQFVRKTLIALASDAALQLKDEIQEGALPILRGNAWRGIEQAAILLGRLDHEPAANDLVRLLKHARDEVKLAAIVALRRLAVKETLPAIHAFAEEHTDAWLKDVADRRANTVLPYRINTEWDNQLAQLFQLFATLDYKQAEPLMRRFIPKNSGFWTEARAAAIWSLGRLHLDKPDDGLVKLFVSRLSDIDPNNPEMLGVRRASSVALGWMKAQGGLKALRTFHDMERMSKHVGGGCRWAIVRITGDELPPLDKRGISESGWFITPTERRELKPE